MKITKNKRGLVHMAYYSAEAPIIGETDKSYKVLMPSQSITFPFYGIFGFDARKLKMPEFEIWVDKENVEIIK